MFVILAAVAMVGGMGWFIWKFAIAPPSAESLLQQIEEANKEPDIQKEIVAKYLKHYGDRDDEPTRKMQRAGQEPHGQRARPGFF